MVHDSADVVLKHKNVSIFYIEKLIAVRIEDICRKLAALREGLSRLRNYNKLFVSDLRHR
jgi:hypothetical protein